MAVLRVDTLNIWNRSDDWDKRLALIRKGLCALEPDLVGLQEVIRVGEHTQAHEIAEGLGYEVGFGVAHDYGGGTAMGNAILSRHPIERLVTFPLPTLDIPEQRSLVGARVVTPHGPLPFFSTHLSWRFEHGYVREAQVQTIAERVASFTDEATLPAVVVGDFNAVPEATEIRFLTGLHSLAGRSNHFADAFAWAGEGPSATFDGTKNPFAAYCVEPPRRIDYVFVRSPDERGRGRPIRARVVFDELVEGTAASDHFGVFAELALSS